MVYQCRLVLDTQQSGGFVAELGSDEGAPDRVEQIQICSGKKDVGDYVELAFKRSVQCWISTGACVQNA